MKRPYLLALPLLLLLLTYGVGTPLLYLTRCHRGMGYTPCDTATWGFLPPNAWGWGWNRIAYSPPPQRPNELWLNLGWFSLKYRNLP